MVCYYKKYQYKKKQQQHPNTVCSFSKLMFDFNVRHMETGQQIKVSSDRLVKLRIKPVNPKMYYLLILTRNMVITYDAKYNSHYSKYEFSKPTNTHLSRLRGNISVSINL